MWANMDLANLIECQYCSTRPYQSPCAYQLCCLPSYHNNKQWYLQGWAFQQYIIPFTRNHFYVKKQITLNQNTNAYYQEQRLHHLLHIVFGSYPRWLDHTPLRSVIG